MLLKMRGWRNKQNEIKKFSIELPSENLFGKILNFSLEFVALSLSCEMSESVNNLLRRRRSSTDIFKKNSMPQLVTELILQHLNQEDQLNFRLASRSTRSIVDSHIRSKFLEWRRQVRRAENLSSDEILVESIQEFTNMNFVPPYVLALIAKTKNLAEASIGPFRDLQMPRIIEEKEEILRNFYRDASKSFSDHQLKTIFTLTTLRILKTLSNGKFHSVRPGNEPTKLRVDFTFLNLFFVLPFYNYIFDWFEFNRDWIDMLALLVKFLEIKSAVDSNLEVTWPEIARPLNFERASFIFGRRNMFSKFAKKPSQITCHVYINANRDMVEELIKFMNGGSFDFSKACPTFSVVCEMECLRVFVSKFKDNCKDFQMSSEIAQNHVRDQ